MRKTSKFRVCGSLGITHFHPILSGPISENVRNILMYICAKFGACITKCTILWNIWAEPWHYHRDWVEQKTLSVNEPHVRHIRPTEVTAKNAGYFCNEQHAIFMTSHTSCKKFFALVPCCCPLQVAIFVRKIFANFILGSVFNAQVVSWGI